MFDIDYAGKTTTPSTQTTATTPRRQGNLSNLYKGVRHLTFGDTNARVYRSHADRVKRIVTESSPYLFLTCSEDGEVSFTEKFKYNSDAERLR